jgi:hypothetical protein
MSAQPYHASHCMRLTNLVESLTLKDGPTLFSLAAASHFKLEGKEQLQVEI